MPMNCERIFDLTMHSSARSNTALFRTRDIHEAHLSTVQDASRAASWVPRALENARWPQGAAQSARARSSSHRVVTVVAARQKRFALGAARRLRQKAEFERLLRQGERRVLEGYTFFLERRAAGRPRLGILISRKHAAAAVERNRIKRCIREAFRLEQERLGPLDVLVRPPYGRRASPDMVSLVRRLLARLNA
jgi:ribonuclease P protein component